MLAFSKKITISILRFVEKHTMQIKPTTCDHVHILENINYAQDHQNEHTLDIIYPKIKTDHYPLIINIHGGGFSMNSKDYQYRQYGIQLASSHYAVANINYRLAPQSPFPNQIEDVLRAIQFLYQARVLYQLNFDQLFLCGDSAGAYLAALTAAIMTNEHYRQYYHFNLPIQCRAIALNCGFFDFTTVIYRDIPFPLKHKMLQILFDDKEYTKLPQFKYTSVTEAITKHFPPTYLMDTEIYSFANESLRLKKRLDQFHITNQFTYFNKSYKLNHAFNVYDTHKESHQVLKEIFHFFSQN